MTVDIIIPFYNALETLDKALASIAIQKVDKGDNIVVTVVNDCSTECTFSDLLEAEARWSFMLDINIVNKEVNRGCGQARQTGMDATDGDAFMFLDADDVLGSPFAVRTLIREMKKTNNDVVMGLFVEEDESGAITQHTENYIWCHGKLYRRRFIERFNLRFNLTRGNEDVGFHSLMRQLTDRISYVGQVVYIWQNQGNSLVRTNHNAYAYGYGWRDFVENMAWAVEGMMERKINKGLSRKFAVETLCRLYWQEMQSNQVLPEEAEKNEQKVIKYYERAVRPFVKDGAVPYDFVIESYNEMIEGFDTKGIIPTRSFDKYLEDMGYFDDLKNIHKEIQ